jgi:hypothetical protein
MLLAAHPVAMTFARVTYLLAIGMAPHRHSFRAALSQRVPRREMTRRGEVRTDRDSTMVQAQLVLQL